MSLATRVGSFAAYAAVVALAQIETLQAWYQYSRADASASHLILIPVVTIGLLVDRRGTIFSSVRSAWLPGALGFVVALALLAASRRSGAEQLSLVLGVASVAVAWMAGFVAWFGWRATRAALFPLGFLVFMIPLPAAVLAGVVQFLKVGSTEAVAGLLTLTGTNYHRDGFVFQLPGLAIEIADECSGIRSTIALVLSGLLAGHLCLRSGWSKLLLLLAVLPVVVLKNAIRITTLTLLSVHVNPSFLQGRLHTDGGVVFFLISLGLLAPVLAALRRIERPRPEAIVPA